MSSSDSSFGNDLPQLRTIRIPGDGRCLFRSIVHGACVRAGKPSPNENLQKELADELRAKVADEFVRRRADTEWLVSFKDLLFKFPHIIYARHYCLWGIRVIRHNKLGFLEGDFDTYILQMRQPHIWGGEPELLMSSHVLQMPVSVYMKDKNSGNLKVIAEYGQEYGKENPIRVLYHGYGHYDALQIPCGGPRSKLYNKR